MQNFSKDEFEKFKSYFKIKDNFSEIEKEFIEKTVKYLNYIKWIPWIKMIWIWNSISMNCATKDSDIDLFIVTNENRLWFVRIIITFVFQILWVRKNEKYHNWRFCLSFFSTNSWMNFWDFALEDDIYLYFWIVYFKPIINFNNTYENFLEENNKWADFFEYRNILEKNKSFIKYSWNKMWNKSKILDLIEKFLKNIFLKKTLKTYEKINKPFWIIINDNMLKFHNWDIRREIKNNLNINK